MSGATYRIELEHHPANEHVRWSAKIVRMSDDFPMQVVSGVSADNAETLAREWIRAETNKAQGVTFYVDDQGRDAEGPTPADLIAYSVKV